MPIPDLQRLWIASDHAGFELKTQLQSAMRDRPWSDLGPASDARVDYPDYAQLLCQKLLADLNGASADESQAEGFSSLGVLICGSGQGMCMAANRNKGIRAALCWTPEVAHLAREHNNANVLCLPGRLISVADAVAVTSEFLQTAFAGGRHLNRIEKF